MDRQNDLYFYLEGYIRGFLSQMILYSLLIEPLEVY